MAALITRARCYNRAVRPGAPLAAVLAVALGLAGCGRPAPTTPLPPLPRDGYAHYLRARVALFEGDHTLAVHELRAAAAAAPDQPMIAASLADALAKAGEQAQARAVIRAGERRWPGEPEIWLVSAELARRAGALAEAGTAYARATRLAPRDERGYLGQASVAIARRRPDEAAAVWRRLIAAVPTTIEARYELARYLAERDRLAEAEPPLRKVVELDPDHLDARLDLARVLRIRGRLAEAITHTRSAFDRSGQDLAVAEELFWLLCEHDDRRGALDLLGLLDDAQATDATRRELARLYLTLHEAAAATAVVTAGADVGWGALVRARAAQLSGDDDGAVATLRAVSADDAQAAEVAALLTDLLRERGQLDAAAEVIGPIAARFPDDVAVRAAAARVQAGRGEVGAARRALRRGLDHERPDSAMVLAEFEVAQGDRAAALVVLDALLRARPNFVPALNLAGYLRAELGLDLARAERDLARARRLAPGEPALLDSWGWVRLRRGDGGTAVRVLAQAHRLAPRDPEILLHYGEALAATGARDRARAVLTEARALARPPLRARIDARRAALRLTDP